MTTLTADQLTSIRYIVGDDLATVAEQQLTDALIQTQYDAATTDAPTSALILPYTYVYCLRMMWGRTRRKVDRVTDNQNRESLSQIVEHTKDLLDYWESKAGLSGVVLTTGVIDLDLDENED